MYYTTIISTAQGKGTWILVKDDKLQSLKLDKRKGQHKQSKVYNACHFLLLSMSTSKKPAALKMNFLSIPHPSLRVHIKKNPKNAWKNWAIQRRGQQVSPLPTSWSELGCRAPPCIFLILISLVLSIHPNIPWWLNHSYQTNLTWELTRLKSWVLDFMG